MMGAQRIAGTIAAISAAGLLVLAIVAAVAGFGSSGHSWTIGAGTGPAMIDGIGPGMMGGGGAGMMGGMGPDMMGHAHLGAGSRGATPPIAGAPTVTVTATDLHFSPTEITLASHATNLALKNDGAVLHDLTIPALGIRIVAAAGQTSTVGLQDLPTGRYAGYCSVPGHANAGMRIDVVVQ